MQNYMPKANIKYNNSNVVPQQQSFLPQQNQPQTPPSYAGVNIQIFNPMVNPTGGNGYIYPQQTASAYAAGTQGGCYPASYYTTQPWGNSYSNGYAYQGGYGVNYPNSQANNQAGFYDQYGKYHPYVRNQNGQIGYLDENGNFRPVKPSGAGGQDAIKDANGNTGFTDKDGKYHQYTKGPNGELGYIDENGQFHPVNSNDPTGNGVNGDAPKDANGNTGFTDKDGKYHQYTKGPNGELGYIDENGQFHPVNPNDPAGNGVNGDAPKDANGNTGFTDKDGKYHQYTKGPNGELGYIDENGQFHPVNPNDPAGNGVNGDAPKDANGNTGFTDKDGKYHQYTKGPNGELGYIDENGQFHPVDPNNPQAGSNKESEKITEKETEKNSESSSVNGEKTEKRKVVALSNDYIKSIENYLDSQDVEVRKMGAHEVIDRLAEDSSRNDDPALTALVNKMLQDPAASIRALALSIVDSRLILGDDLTVNLLKKMQSSKDGFGLDAQQATGALLKMAQKTVEKEVPVTETQNNSSIKSDRPKMPYFFKSDKDKYEWLMKNGCSSDSETKWVENYIANNAKNEDKK